MRTFIKEDGEYKEILKILAKPIEFCAAIRTIQKNVFLKHMKQYFDLKMPSVLHECPYTMVAYIIIIETLFYTI